MILPSLLSVLLDTLFKTNASKAAMMGGLAESFKCKLRSPRIIKLPCRGNTSQPKCRAIDQQNVYQLLCFSWITLVCKYPVLRLQYYSELISIALIPCTYCLAVSTFEHCNTHCKQVLIHFISLGFWRLYLF